MPLSFLRRRCRMTCKEQQLLTPKKVSVVLIGIDVGLWMQVQTWQAGRLKFGLPSDVAVVGYVAGYDSQI